MNPFLTVALKESRKKAGLTQTQAAQALNVKQTTISNYEKGVSEPDIDTFIKLCDLYNVDFSSILNTSYELENSAAGQFLTTDEENLLKLYRDIDDDDKALVHSLLDRLAKPTVTKSLLISDGELNKTSYRTLTLYGGRPAAGSGNWIPSDSLPTSQIQVIDNAITRKADFVLVVDGHSMEPKFSDGDEILVQHADAVDPGEIGVFLVNGNAVIKQAQNGYLHSLNKEYPDIELSEDDTVICFGRVIGKI